MTGIGPEALFWTALGLLYLSDLFVLLCFNEALVLDGRGGFAARVEPSRAEVRNKRLHVLNPLTPHVAAFRVFWGAGRGNDAGAAADEAGLRAASGALRTPARLCAALGALLFLAFPATSMAVGFESALLPVAALAYGLLLAITVLVVSRAPALRVPPARLATVLVVAWLCIPCAVNLVRRASLLMEVEADAAALLPRLLDADAWARAAAAVRARAREEIERGLDEVTESRLKSYIATALPE